MGKEERKRAENAQRLKVTGPEEEMSPLRDGGRGGTPSEVTHTSFKSKKDPRESFRERKPRGRDSITLPGPTHSSRSPSLSKALTCPSSRTHQRSHPLLSLGHRPSPGECVTTGGSLRRHVTRLRSGSLGVVGPVGRRAEVEEAGAPPFRAQGHSGGRRGGCPPDLCPETRPFTMGPEVICFL